MGIKKAQLGNSYLFGSCLVVVPKEVQDETVGQGLVVFLWLVQAMGDIVERGCGHQNAIRSLPVLSLTAQP